jgi:hypothetical protein
MDSQTISIALNLLWAAMALAAAGVLVVCDRRPRTVCAALILSVCLFPSISSSDDLLRFSILGSHLGGRSQLAGAADEESQPAGSGTLLFVLHTLDHGQAEDFWLPVLVFFVAGSVFCARRGVTLRHAAASASRAPPRI